MRKAVVGVIGPEDIVRQIAGMADYYPNLSLRPLPYNHLEDTPDIVRQYQRELDIILFTSEVQLLHCRYQVNLSIPVVTVPFSPSSLYRAVFRARDLLRQDGAFLSVDGLSADKAQEALRDLGLPTDPIHALEFHEALSHEQMVNFHLDLWRQGKTHVIFTYYRAGYQELQALGAPVFLVDHEAPVLHQALQTVLLEAKALRSQDAQLMFGLIDIDRFADMARDLGSEYEIHKFKLQFQSEIVNLIQPLGGVLFSGHMADCCVVTTRGVIEELSARFSGPVFLHKLKERFDISVSEGWGAGPVADTARRHAETALRFAKSDGGDCAFVVLDETQTLGPLGRLESWAVSLTSLDSEILEMANSVGVSARTVDRLRFLVRKLGRAELMSSEVAQELNMTERNARRILGKLMAVNLASVGGQDFSYPRGRPRRVFRILSPLAP